ncbi:MAG: PKD domain-containing protein [Bacteroidia bacterium]
MKKIAILLITLISALGVKAQMSNDLFISGYVTMAGSGNAVSDYPVYVSGINGASEMVYTNDNGWYNVTITNGSVTGPNQLYIIYTEDSCSLAYLSDTISNNQGMIDEAVVNFEICGNEGPMCQAMFVAATNEMTIHAENNSTGEALNFIWSVNGVNVSDSENLTFLAPEAGVYVVCLHVFNDLCDNTYCQSITVVGNNVNACNPEFFWNPNGNNNAGDYTFIPAADQISPANYVWLLDGTPFSDNYQPGAIALTAGEHSVCHIVSTANCVDSLCQTIVVSEDTLQGCQAYYTWSISPADPFRVLAFDDSYVESPNVTYLWTINNDILGDGAVLEHTFANAGYYNICLTISTENCSDTYCTSVYVPGEGNTNECNAAFEWDVMTAPVNGISQVNFFAIGDNPGIGQTEHYWYVGNEFPQSGAIAEFNLEVPGVYSVCHIVQNNAASCFDSLCVEIVLTADTVGNDCNAYFSASVSQAYPLRMLFSNMSTPGASNSASFYWELGDGVVSDAINPEHTYPEAGYYTVCLTITTDNCSSTYCDMIYVPGENNTSYYIAGQVFAGNNIADIGSAKLFSYDPVSMAVELIQTVSLDSGYYYFDGLEAGTYLVKAGLNENSAYFGNYVPTYFGSQYYWFNAEPIVVPSSGTGYIISLMWAGNNGGPGWVNGDIDDGPYRLSGAAGASSALLVSDADVIVTDLTGNPQRFTVSDNNGEFMISNLAYGTYRLMADVAGMICVPVEFTISPATPNVSISLVMGDEITGIAETPAVSIGALYPNPASNQVNMNITLKQSEKLNITITTTAGQLIRTEARTISAGSQTLGVPVSGIANGFYFLSISDANNKTLGNYKISVIH